MLLCLLMKVLEVLFCNRGSNRTGSFKLKRLLPFTNKGAGQFLFNILPRLPEHEKVHINVGEVSYF